jgi:aryl-alcohol dehydrogenase-like predicted oxidoreductase
MANSSPAYGALNSARLTSETLEAMWKEGFRRVDSAEAYQAADEILRQTSLNWEVQTKIRINEDSISRESLRELVEKSTKRKRIQTLLIHNPDFVSFPNSSKLLEMLKDITSSYGVERIGISIYRPHELAQVTDWELIEVVQFPHNPFDASCLEWFERNPPRANLTLQARSIFLQGLLVTNPITKTDIPKALLDEVNQWHAWLGHRKISATQYCVDYAVKSKRLDEMVIGVESISQGTEILSYFNRTEALKRYERRIDPAITDPRMWKN